MADRFQIPFDAVAVADLHRRLDATRWNDAVSDDWSMGTELGFLKTVVHHWRHEYDWAARVARFNTFPHFTETIADLRVHFLHVRAERDDATPLLLMNGWPSSFVEFEKIIPLLTGGENGFHLVIPTMPGYGFSDRPTLPYQVELSDLYLELMLRLGYDHFVAAGTDIGSGVATRIALRHPERLIALHVSSVAPKPRREDAGAFSPAEDDYRAQIERWQREDGAYQALQSTKPQTLAFGLADSPVGMAAWILEKVRGWTDCEGDVLVVWPMETLIDNLTIYWMTATIGSSVRFYLEAAQLRPSLRADDFVRTPTGVAMWPHDLIVAPREVAAQVYNVVAYSRPERGGHFPAWEQPEAYADDIRRLVAIASG